MRTLGVEEELLLVDGATGSPTSVAAAVLARGPGGDQPEGAFEAELQQQQVETNTAPRELLDEVDTAVRAWRRYADAEARRAGARAVALGTSPLAARPTTTPTARYQAMAEHFGLTTLEQLTCGLHVHVEVASRAEGVGVLDRIRVWLPVLLALSANSPLWQGADSAYASFRSQAWSRFPSAGPTDAFGSPEAYEERVAALVASGVLLDSAMIYFDARLSETYPTVEVRVADVCLDAADTVTLAGVTRALVETAARDWRAGGAAPAVPTELVRLAAWRAGRSGVGGDLLDPLTARPRRARDVVTALVAFVAPAAGEDGARIRDGVRRILERGTGADAQRAALRRTGDLAAVVADAADRTLG